MTTEDLGRGQIHEGSDAERADVSISGRPAAPAPVAPPVPSQDAAAPVEAAAACGGNPEEADTPPPAGNVIRIPDGVQIECAQANKGFTKVTLFLSNGERIVIDDPDHMPTIIVDGAEVPRATLEALMNQGPCVEAPLSVPGSGGDFAVEPQPLPQPFDLTPLLPPTELPPLELPPPEFIEVINALEIPEVQVAVDEEALDDQEDGLDLEPGVVFGTNPDSTAETVTGSLDLSGTVGGEVTSITFDGTTFNPGDEFVTDHGVIVVNADGTFIYTLTNPADHTSGEVFELFEVEVTDHFGNIIDGTIKVNIIDDEPLVQEDFAAEDRDTVQSGDVLNGNVITDGDGDAFDEADTPGADGAIVTGVSNSDDPSSHVSGNVGVPVDDENGLGTIVINADGSFTFTANPNVSGTAIFTYTLTDGDGDMATTTVTVDVVDGSPLITNEENEVEESDLDQNALPDGDDLAPGNVTGSTPGGADETTSGTIVFSDPQGDPVSITSVTFGGTTVAPGVQISGDFGVLVVNADGTYTYTLTDNADHSGGAVSEVFTVEVSDAFGNTSIGTLTINIVDDVPSAVADFDAVQSGGAETGNVITDAEGDGGADTEGADGAVVTGVSTSDSGAGPVAGNVGTPIPDEGGLGTLTLNGDGSYSFTANPNVSGTAIYTYTLTDGDGDTSSTTLTIEVENGTPTVGSATEEVEESDLDQNALPDGDDLAPGNVTGSTPGGSDETVTGSITLNDPQGDPLTVTVTFDGNTVNAGTQINGDFGVLLLNADGTFTYTLTDNADHSGGPVSEVFTVEATDPFGNTTTGTITINIVDDVPTAVADFDAVQSGGAETGNVITDAEGDGGADTEGADGAVVTGVSTSDSGAGPVVGNVGAPIPDEGGLGTLTLNADGSYSFTANPNVSGTAIYTYTLTDGDGDTSTTTLTIDVEDGRPEVGDSHECVFEKALDTNPLPDGDDLAPGNVTGSMPGSSAETVIGAISITDPDGATVTSIEFDGQTFNPGDEFVTDHGVIKVNADGTYTYTLTDNADHSGGGVNEFFTVTVTDAFGNTSTGTIQISIIDDHPTAVADFDAVQSGGAETGNVITDAEGDGGADTEGADGAVVTGVSTSDSGAGPVVGNVGAPIPDEGGLGTLTLNADGSYSFTANPNVSGTAIYTYTITDGDGDTSSTTLTIDVENGTPTVGSATEEVEESDLDQNALPDGDDLAPGNVTGSTPGGSDETVTGSITLNDPQGDPLTVTVTFDGNTVNAGTQINGDFGVLLLNADGSFTYTLTDNADHSGGPVSEVFTVEATDPFGNTTTGTITINIVDDVPTAVADFDCVQSGDTALGNVMTDGDGDLIDEADTEGADGAVVTGVSTSDSGAGPVAGNVNTPLPDEGGLGTLTLNADGSYSFTANPNMSGTAVYTYTITDGDGDTSTTTLTINVKDGTPEVEDTEVQVDEFALDTNPLPDGDDLAPGTSTGTNPGASTETVTGTFSFSDSDGTAVVSSITFGLVTVVAGVAIAGDHGLLVVEEDGSFIYTLTDHADHSGGPVSEVFTVTVTDDFGNTNTGTITVNITNDVPIINSIQSGVLANEAGTITGEIDGAIGADEFDHYVLALQDSLDGVTVSTMTLGDGSEQLTATIDSSGDTFFILTFMPDGTYTFELVTERPVSEETVTLLNLTPGQPQLSVVASDGTVFTGLGGGLINSSANGFGVDNNQFEKIENPSPVEESFRADFTSAISSVTFETFDGGNPNDTFTVDWEVFDENGVSLESGTITVTGDEDIVIDPVVDEFWSVELTATDGSTKLLTFTKTVFLVPEDLTLLFDVDMYDTDNDFASGVLQIDLEGGDGTFYTLTGTPGSDVLLGASTDDILSALGGDDDLIGGGGSDTYTGGSGDDVFVIDISSLGMAVEDMITDYESGDTVDLTALFNDPTPGDVSDYARYNELTGELQVDADGAGPGGFVTVATVESGGSPVASVTILYEDGSDQQHTATIT